MSGLTAPAGHARRGGLPYRHGLFRREAGDGVDEAGEAARECERLGAALLYGCGLLAVAGAEGSEGAWAKLAGGARPAFAYLLHERVFGQSAERLVLTVNGFAPVKRPERGVSAL